MRHRHDPPAQAARLLPGESYGSPLYGFNQLFLLMRSSTTAARTARGIGCVKLKRAGRQPYMFRERSIKTNSLARIFKGQLKT